MRRTEIREDKTPEQRWPTYLGVGLILEAFFRGLVWLVGWQWDVGVSLIFWACLIMMHREREG